PAARAGPARRGPHPYTEPPHRRIPTLAWLGAIAIVGLVMCAVGELHDFLRTRKERKLPPGATLPPTRWTGRRLAFFSVSGILALALIGFLVNLALPTPKQIKISTKNAT